MEEKQYRKIRKLSRDISGECPRCLLKFRKDEFILITDDPNYIRHYRCVYVVPENDLQMIFDLGVLHLQDDWK